MSNIRWPKTAGVLMAMFFILATRGTARADNSQIWCTELTAYDSFEDSVNNPAHYLNARQFGGGHILATFEMATLDTPPVNVEEVWHDYSFYWDVGDVSSDLLSLNIDPWGDTGRAATDMDALAYAGGDYSFTLSCYVDGYLPDTTHVQETQYYTVNLHFGDTIVTFSKEGLRPGITTSIPRDDFVYVYAEREYTSGDTTVTFHINNIDESDISGETPGFQYTSYSSVTIPDGYTHTSGADWIEVYGIAPTGNDNEYDNHLDASTGDWIPVTVVVPFSIATPHPTIAAGDASNPVAGHNEAGDATRSVAGSELVYIGPLSAGNVHLWTVYVHLMTLGVADQFGKPLPDLYEGSAVEEFLNGAYHNIYWPLAADSTYVDPVGAYRPSIYSNVPAPSGANVAAQWITATAAGYTPIPLLRPRTIDPTIPLKIDGKELNTGIVNRTVSWSVGNPSTITVTWP